MTKYIVFSQTGSLARGITIGKKYEVFPGETFGGSHIVDDHGDRRSTAIWIGLARGWAEYSKPKYMENK